MIAVGVESHEQGINVPNCEPGIGRVIAAPESPGQN